MKISKDTTINISVSTLVSIIGTIVSVWLFAAPLAQRAMAGEIKEQISPVVDAFQVILLQQIESQQEAILAMQFKKERSKPDEWTLDDEKKLHSAMERLNATVMALQKMQEKSK